MLHTGKSCGNASQEHDLGKKFLPKELISCEVKDFEILWDFCLEQIVKLEDLTKLQMLPT